jgi:hypothetical protein
MSVFTKRAVLVDGIRVEVLEAGSGEPLIYFHGAGTTSGFQDLLPLSRSRRLIVRYTPASAPRTTTPESIRCWIMSSTITRCSTSST